MLSGCAFVCYADEAGQYADETGVRRSKKQKQYAGEWDCLHAKNSGGTNDSAAWQAGTGEQEDAGDSGC